MTLRGEMKTAPQMYLIDTNVISELRKQNNANHGVVAFMAEVKGSSTPCYLSVVTIGELKRGIEIVHHRGDTKQAEAMRNWYTEILREFSDLILPIDQDVASMWALLRVPNHENAIDKFIAATALLYSLTVVTRNVKDFDRCGVRTLNPFS